MKYRHILIVGLISLILCLAVVALGSHPYISNPGTLLDGFENVNDWTVTGTGATAEDDTSIFKQGSQSIKLNAVGGNSATLAKSNLTLSVSNEGIFSIWVYVADKTKLSYISYYITSQANYSKYFYKDWFIYADGWSNLIVAKSQFSNGGGESWDNTMIKMKFVIYPTAGQNVSVNFDDFIFGIVGQPKVIITFDDDWSSQIDKAYPIMVVNGQRGVLFVYTNGIGLNPNLLSLANLRTLKSAGWDICNHTSNHIDLTTASQEDMEASIDGGYNWLVAHGFGDTAKFFAYPYGHWHDAVVAKIKQRHVLARATAGLGYHFDLFNFDDKQYKLKAYTIANTISVATAETVIDTTIEQGGLLIILFHDISDTDGSKYLSSNFQAISDYLKTKQDAGLLEVITFSDYYNALIGLEPEPFCLEKPAMDFNGDCKVDFADFALFAQSWLECNLEPKSACWE